MPNVKYSLLRGDTSGIASAPLEDGQILFDKTLGKIAIDAMVDGTLTRIDMSGNDIFSGTTAEWTALTDEKKAEYKYVYLTDDFEDTIAVMTGATASSDGAAGLAPKPLAGEQNKILRGDGTWGAVIEGETPYFTANGETATFHPGSATVIG